MGQNSQNNLRKIREINNVNTNYKYKLVSKDSNQLTLTFKDINLKKKNTDSLKKIASC